MDLRNTPDCYGSLSVGLILSAEGKFTPLYGLELRILPWRYSA